MPLTEIAELQVILSQFATDREWQQFHTPANLAKAISCEAAELLEQFLWNDDITWKNCPNPTHDAICDEVADVFIYLLGFCDVMGIDLIISTKAKIINNDAKYPVDKCRGSALKYDKL